MAQPHLLFPSELWIHMFGYLSAADKSNVRASCKYFKKLVDHGSLWRDWTVVLDFKNGGYNSKFWVTLRRRKVTSVVMRSTKYKDWKQLSLSLPALTTVVTNPTSDECLSCLKDFPHLKRLAIRGSCMLLEALTVSQPQQLTHLSMCGVNFVPSLEGLISTVSQFTHLTSLVCHQMGIPGEEIWVIESILHCLPKLKHLSLSSTCCYSVPTRKPDFLGRAKRQAGDRTLSSLELTDCTDDALPDSVMSLMPGLESLAVFYKHSQQEKPEKWFRSRCQLKTWLGDLPLLSRLVIVKGPLVKMYVTSIPATVTSLTLCVAGLSSRDMAAIAVQIPNLHHLHIDPWPSHLGALAAEIPKLFPKLRSLKLRHQHVPEKDFLHLRQLQDLEHLEILDDQPHLSELIGKLQALTNYRLQVTVCPPKRDVLSCPCVYQVY